MTGKVYVCLVCAMGHCMSTRSVRKKERCCCCNYTADLISAAHFIGGGRGLVLKFQPPLLSLPTSWAALGGYSAAVYANLVCSMSQPVFKINH